MRIFHKTFSLIELLVITAVLSVLMSLMFKSLNSSLEKSREIHCRHNLLRLGQGAAVYSDAHDQKMPINGYTVLRNGRTYSSHASLLWKFLIGDYVYGKTYQHYSKLSQRGNGSEFKNASISRIHNDLTTNIFQCPQAFDLKTEDGFEYEDLLRWRRGGYGINGHLKDKNITPTEEGVMLDNAFRSTDLTRPQDTIVLADTLHWNVSRTFPQWLMDTNQMNMRGHFYRWHNGGINTVWADLHVSLIDDVELRAGEGKGALYYFKVNKNE